MHARLLNSIGTTKIGHALRSYFYSGWAFLIPYLAVYLLYYATKWPVNPSIRSEHLVAGGHQGWAPCMLHVYWALHAIHAIGAGVALWSWWKQRTLDLTTDYANEHGLNSNPPEAGTPLAHEAEVSSPLNVERPLTPSANYQLPTTNYSEIFFRLAPWALLALLFYIPGVYLEWPSDPWEHLRRINEWRILDTVGAHSSWHKSAYFIPYSLLSWCIGLRQLFWLDFYYTGICLLLCWQYYRFSRACGLGERASMVFVIIQAILFGNNIFSFYRYYGISSSIYAQLGAIALTRIVLEFASRGTKLDPVFCHADHGVPTQSQNLEAGRGEDKSQHPTPITQSPTPHTATPLAPRVTPAASDNRPLTSSYWPLPSVLWLLASGFCLLTLTAFNHSQGLGIAGLGIAAIIVWRLIEWKRTTLWWLIGGTIVINALFLWLYPRPPVIETYRTQGWLNAWYGFNLFTFGAPANDRLLHIFSLIGMPALLVSLFLIAKNHITAWLTIIPVLGLVSPVMAIPFSISLANHYEPAVIVTFQRMLLGSTYFMIFAIVCRNRCTCLAGTDTKIISYIAPLKRRASSDSVFISPVMIAALCYAVCIPSTAPFYNRMWHATHSTANDLKMKSMVATISELSKTPDALSEPAYAMFQIGAVVMAAGCDNVPYFWRNLQDPVAPHGQYILHKIRTESRPPSFAFALKPTALYTWSSLSGQLSTHWNPRFTPVSCFGSRQIAESSTDDGFILLKQYPAVVLRRN